MIRTTLTVEGMACSMCEAHINDVVRRTCSVKKVSSSRKKGTTVILSETPPDTFQLREAIHAAGYTVTSATVEPYAKRWRLLFRY